MSDAYTLDVRVDPKGRITIPKDVRAALGAAKGGKVTFIVEGNEIRVVNAALHALSCLQAQLWDAVDRTGLPDERSVSDWVASRRKGDAR